MRGLFRKEFYNSRGVLIIFSLIIACIFFWFTVFSSIKISTLTGLSVYMAGFIPYIAKNVLEALDIASKWNKFILTTPVSRGQIVLVRYLYLGICVLLNLVIFVSAGLVHFAMYGWSANYLPVVICSSFSALLTLAVYLPIGYRKPMKYNFISGIIFIPAVWIVNFGVNLAFTYIPFPAAVTAAYILLSLAAMTASYFCSCRMFKKVEIS